MRTQQRCVSRERELRRDGWRDEVGGKPALQLSRPFILRSN
jgi:hypothetical protein